MQKQGGALAIHAPLKRLNERSFHLISSHVIWPYFISTKLSWTGHGLQPFSSERPSVDGR